MRPTRCYFVLTSWSESKTRWLSRDYCEKRTSKRSQKEHEDARESTGLYDSESSEAPPQADLRFASRVISRDKPWHLAIDTFGEFELAYRKGTADEKVIAHSFDRDIYFPGVSEYVQEKNHVIIDAGAHIGTFSLLASAKATEGKVYAIEPNEESFNLLRINSALNRRGNISAHHLALGDRDGVSSLFCAARNWGHSTVARRNWWPSSKKNIESVETMSIQTFLATHQIQTCHFMKMNCEGAEFPILLATPPATLRIFRMMLVLYHLDLWRNNTLSDLISHLKAAGFACREQKKTDVRGWLVAVVGNG